MVGIEVAVRIECRVRPAEEIDADALTPIRILHFLHRVVAPLSVMPDQVVADFLHLAALVRGTECACGHDSCCPQWFVSSEQFCLTARRAMRDRYRGARGVPAYRRRSSGRCGVRR